MITLISYDNTDDPSRTLRALQHCAKLMRFAAVVLVCRVVPQGVIGETVYQVNEQGYDAAMMWEVAGIRDHVWTNHALCVHHDGYIVNPDMWRDYWLDYDFIGSPWPALPNAAHPGKSDSPHRVGNTGFCLKSKAFIDETAKLEDAYRRVHRNIDKHGQKLGGDTYCCQHQRPHLESVGIKYAPIDVAADFSWESTIEEYPLGRPDAFGFHNFNLEYKDVPRV